MRGDGEEFRIQESEFRSQNSGVGSRDAGGREAPFDGLKACREWGEAGRVRGKRTSRLSGAILSRPLERLPMVPFRLNRLSRMDR